MNANPCASYPGRRPDDATSTEIFKALSRNRRQSLLEYLSQRSGAVPIPDLAEYLASQESPSSSMTSDRILLELYHIHLPQLAAAELIRYDTTRELVELRVHAADIRPFLDLTAASIRRQDDH
jgi:hypothetical protein